MSGVEKKQYPQAEPFLGIQLNLVETSKLHTVVNTIFDYQALASIDLNHQIKSISELPQELLGEYPELKERQRRIEAAILKNHALLHSIIDQIKKPLEYENTHYHYSRFRLFKLLEVVQTEWSQEGRENRKYIETIRELLKRHTTSKDILITGIILGRLIFQLSSEYNISANEEEFDYFLVANYFLNLNQGFHTIHPFIHNFSNHLSEDHAFHQVTVPDTQITPNSHQIGVSLGNFSWIYRHQKDMWQCIILHFGLEGGNPINILERAYECLKKSGKLLIVTSLNYEGGEIELFYDDIVEIGVGMGMKVLEECEEKQEVGSEGSLLRSERTIMYVVFEKV